LESQGSCTRAKKAIDFCGLAATYISPVVGPASQLTVGCMMVLEADKTIGGGEPLRLPLR